jgi:hypothetical protein
MGPKTKITNVNLAIGEKDGNLCVHEVHVQTTEMNEYMKVSMKELKATSNALSHEIRDRLESDGYTLLFLVAAVGLANKPLRRYAFTTVFNPDYRRLMPDIRHLLIREYMRITQIAANGDLQAQHLYEDYQAITNYIKDNNIA